MIQLPFHDQIFADLPPAYLVGGSVRDLVRGVKPLDYDVVVPSAPHRFAGLMAERVNGKVIVLGKDHFCVHRVVSKNVTIDVTAFKGNDIGSDLKARDFTFNALAWDLAGGHIIDLLGGVKDLQEGRVRMASADAFADDPARLIRAFRMAAALGFQIEPLTLEAITKQAAEIQQVAGERVWAELERILSLPQSLPTLRLMADSELLLHIIPEFRSMIGCNQNRYHDADVFTHTLQAYQSLETILSDPEATGSPSAAEWTSTLPVNDKIVIKLALLLHDTGKPQSRSVSDDGNVHFYGHPARGAVLCRTICRRLRVSNRYKDRIETIIRHHQRPLSLFLARRATGLLPRTLGRFFRQCADLTPHILVHAMADDMGKCPREDNLPSERIVFYQDLMEKYFEVIAKRSGTPLINGSDLMKIFNLKPSPRLGRIIKTMQELQMAGVLNNREQAERWVADYLHGEDGK